MHFLKSEPHNKFSTDDISEDIPSYLAASKNLITLQKYLSEVITGKIPGNFDFLKKYLHCCLTRISKFSLRLYILKLYLTTVSQGSHVV